VQLRKSVKAPSLKNRHEFETRKLPVENSRSAKMLLMWPVRTHDCFLVVEKNDEHSMRVRTYWTDLDTSFC